MPTIATNPQSSGKPVLLRRLWAALVAGRQLREVGHGVFARTGTRVSLEGVITLMVCHRDQPGDARRVDHEHC